MASLRITVRLLASASNFTAEAVTASLSPAGVAHPPPGIVGEIVRLIARTIQSNPHASTSEQRELEQLLGALTRRYGTLGGAVEALGEGRRRYPAVRLEPALGWHHAFEASLSSVESVLRKHPVMAKDLRHWLTEHEGRIEDELGAYDKWLHATPVGAEGSGPELAAARVEHAPGVAEARALLLDDKPLGDLADSPELIGARLEAVEALEAMEDPVARAVALIARGKLDEADRALEALDAQDPALRMALEGDRLFAEGRFEEAVERYRAARVALDDRTARFNLASALIMARSLGDPARQEATRLLEALRHEAGPGSEERVRATAMLGTACLIRTDGQRDILLRRAIELLEEALGAIDRQTRPRWWAQAHAALGSAWSVVPGVRRAENLQRAITCFERAHEVWTEQSDPNAWALVENLLGHAWEALPTGDRASHLTKAIDHYERAMRVHTAETNPTAWATLMNNLGNAWVQRPDGDKKKNIQKAIECQQQALEVWSREGRRGEWAATLNNLGNAWALLPGSANERVGHLREAVSCYKQALDVRTRSTHPHEWAATQNNLGNALLLIPGDDAGKNAKEAASCFEHALTVRTRDAAPVDWARTQANLGHAWARRTDADAQENLGRAVHCYTEALTVLTKKDFPHHYEHIRARLEEVQDRLDDVQMLS